MSNTFSDPNQITELLRTVKNIAVVGLTSNPMRPSNSVSEYMQSQGYRIIPVNPNEREVLGEKAYATLADVPEKIDLVNVFRRPEFVADIVQQTIALKVPAIWLQEGVIDERAAQAARDAGLVVIMDRCILKEHRRRRL
jgi:predicted CoA-binding protein